MSPETIASSTVWQFVGDNADAIGVLLAVLGIAGAIIMGLSKLVKFYIERSDKVKNEGLTRLERLENRDRQQMLENVHNIWIRGVLEQSLYNIARIELSLTEVSNEVNHPLHLEVLGRDGETRDLHSRTSILEVYDSSNKSLLVLGAPGAGKTTLLLELARDLIARAKNDPEHPIPVIFNLSTWATDLGLPFSQWLIDELHKRYFVPKQVAQKWVENVAVLPLLDGLDEVARENRNACVEAINHFHKQHGLLPVVVCSRDVDYAELVNPLCLQNAIKVKPLTRTQVEAYFESAGSALSGARTVLHEDETLWELLDNPLMLSIFAFAYGGKVTSDNPTVKFKGNVEERRAALFNLYIEAMFKRRATTLLYTPEKTRHWLSWLARVMAKYDQSVFYIERMQPAWFSNSQARFYYLTGLGLVVGLISLCAFGFFSAFAPVYIWVVIVVFLRWEEIHPVKIPYWSSDLGRRGLYAGLIPGIFLGLSIALFFGYSFGPIFGMVSGLLGGLIVAMIVSLVTGVIGGQYSERFEDNISLRTIQNFGIHSSWRNATVYGLGTILVVLSTVLTIGLGLVLVIKQDLDIVSVQWLLHKVLTSVLPFALLIGLIVWLVNGGRACIQHSILRLLLWRYDYAPLRYVQFLEHAKDLLFLRRVGGGYIFVHRMLMEHFAALKETITEQQVNNPTSSV